MTHVEFAGRVQSVVEMTRSRKLSPDSAIERITELSDEMKTIDQFKRIGREDPSGESPPCGGIC